MHISVGDLVTVKQRKDDSLGIVVKKTRPIQGLEKSKHTQHILSSYAPVYYICSMSGIYNGPYQKSDLLLQQTLQVPVNDMCDHPRMNHD